MINCSAELLHRPEEAANIKLGKVSIPSLFRDLPEAVIVADENRRIVWANNAALSMFGHTIDQMAATAPPFFTPVKKATCPQARHISIHPDPQNNIITKATICDQMEKPF